MAYCAVDADLSKQVADALAKLADLSREALEAFRAGRHGDMMSLDKEVELALGEKERTIGALRQHRQEHRCSAGLSSENDK